MRLNQILRRLFALSSDDSLAGLPDGEYRFTTEVEYRAELPRDVPSFFRALPLLFDPPALLFIHGGHNDDGVNDLIDAWRSSQWYHAPSRKKRLEPYIEIAVTPNSMEALAGLATNVPPAEVRTLYVEHPVGPRHSEILLAWMFGKIEITGRVSEERLYSFATSLSVRVFRREASPDQGP